MITFNLERMTATQLAMLYKLLVKLYRSEDARKIYEAGVINCGAEAFCEEVARA